MVLYSGILSSGVFQHPATMTKARGNIDPENGRPAPASVASNLKIGYSIRIGGSCMDSEHVASCFPEHPEELHFRLVDASCMLKHKVQHRASKHILPYLACFVTVAAMPVGSGMWLILICKNRPRNTAKTPGQWAFPNHQPCSFVG